HFAGFARARLQNQHTVTVQSPASQVAADVHDSLEDFHAFKILIQVHTEHRLAPRRYQAMRRDQFKDITVVSPRRMDGGIALEEFDTTDTAAGARQLQLRYGHDGALTLPERVAVLELHFGKAIFTGGELESFEKWSVDWSFRPPLHVGPLDGHVALHKTQANDTGMSRLLREGEAGRKQDQYPCRQGQKTELPARFHGAPPAA